MIIDYSTSKRQETNYSIIISTTRLDRFNPIIINCEVYNVEYSRAVSIRSIIGDAIEPRKLYAYSISDSEIDTFLDELPDTNFLQFDSEWYYVARGNFRSHQIHRWVNEESIILGVERLEEALQFHESIRRMQRLVIQSFSFKFSDGYHDFV